MPDLDAKKRHDSYREALVQLRTRKTELRQARDEAHQAGDREATSLAEQGIETMDAEIERVASLQSIELRRMDGSPMHIGGGDDFRNNPEILNTLERAAHAGGSGPKVGQLDLGTIMSREQWMAQFDKGRMMSDSWGREYMAAAGDTTIPTTARQGAYQGIVEPLYRPRTLLDFIPMASMEANSFDYTQMTYTTAAATVADAALKAGSNITLTDATCIAKTFAEFAKVPRPQIADVPQLAGSVQRLLQNDVLQTLESADRQRHGLRHRPDGHLLDGGHRRSCLSIRRRDERHGSTRQEARDRRLRAPRGRAGQHRRRPEDAAPEGSGGCCAPGRATGALRTAGRPAKPSGAFRCWSRR